MVNKNTLRKARTVAEDYLSGLPGTLSSRASYTNNISIAWRINEHPQYRVAVNIEGSEPLPRLETGNCDRPIEIDVDIYWRKYGTI